MADKADIVPGNTSYSNAGRKGDIYTVKIAIIIPTYIKADSLLGLKASNGFKMLKRALESLKTLRGGHSVSIILPFCIEGKGMEEGRDQEHYSVLMEALADIAVPYKKFILTTHNLKAIKRYVSQRGFSDVAERLDLCGFPNIRNCGLILAQALGAEVAIFIDNDEVIDAPDFLDIALTGLFAPVNGRKADGKGGFYTSGSGKVYERTVPPWWQCCWKKVKLFEEVWETILTDKERFVETPVILGGNMVLTRRLFENIPFDPLVPRGEDIDYLINARAAGFKVLFDKQLKIRHLPLERTISYRKEELKGDIARFVYERAKVTGCKGLNLDPYPGYFLKGDLKVKAFITVMLFSLYLASNLRWKDAIEVYTYLGPLFKKKKEKGFYEAFKQRWAALMGFIRNDGLNDILKEGSF